MQLLGICPYRVFPELMVITLKSWCNSSKECTVKGCWADRGGAQNPHQDPGLVRLALNRDDLQQGGPVSGTLRQRLNSKHEEGHIGDPGEEAVLFQVPFQPLRLYCATRCSPFPTMAFLPENLSPACPRLWLSCLSSCFLTAKTRSNY